MRRKYGAMCDVCCTGQRSLPPPLPPLLSLYLSSPLPQHSHATPSSYLPSPPCQPPPSQHSCLLQLPLASCLSSFLLPPGHTLTIPSCPPPPTGTYTLHLYHPFTSSIYIPYYIISSPAPSTHLPHSLHITSSSSFPVYLLSSSTYPSPFCGLRPVPLPSHSVIPAIIMSQSWRWEAAA